MKRESHSLFAPRSFSRLRSRFGAAVRAPTCIMLLVEDDTDMRDAMSWLLILKVPDCRIVQAEDGEVALEKLRAGLVPCVIVLDLHMPRMDGRGFRSAQRADPALCEIPVVLYSATYDLQEIARELGLGPEQYVRKPFDMGTLLERVRHYCPA